MRELDRLAAVLADGQILRAKQLGRAAGGVVVEFVDQEDVRPHALNHFGDLAAPARCRRFEVANELAGLVAK